MVKTKLVLVINSGSSSLKFKLFSFPAKAVISEGQIERIGQNSAQLKLEFHKNEIQMDLGSCDHEKAFAIITQALIDNKIIYEPSEIQVVGHRVVHGGDTFNKPVIVNDEVKSIIRSLFFLAPLHNPANLTGILSAENAFPDAVQVVVFDTAFHSTIPDYAHRYALPNEYYEKYHVRVYGFHGTSHKYVAEQWYAMKGSKQGKLITLHLGNGCSMAAVKDGECIDTSLGFSPTSGLIMGTRSGDIDPMIVPYLMDKLSMSVGDISNLLNKNSGMQGVSGKSDLREIIKGAKAGNKYDLLALEMSAYRIRKYIGAYIAAMNGLDALIFTAGIGENSDYFRALVLTGMDFLKLNIDLDKNKNIKKENSPIHIRDSQVEIWVIPTNEELEIAQQAYELIKKEMSDLDTSFLSNSPF